MRPRRSASSHSAGCRIALVEDEVDHLQHRRQPPGELAAARHLERDLRVGQGPLGAHDALGNCWLGDEECPRDLVGGQPAEQPKCQRDARLGCEHRMAGDEDQAQQIVADVLVDRRVEVAVTRFLLGLEVASDFLLLALESRFAAQHIDRPMLRRAHEPRPRIARHARFWPLLERRHQRVLGQLLS